MASSPSAFRQSAVSFLVPGATTASRRMLLSEWTSHGAREAVSSVVAALVSPLYQRAEPAHLCRRAGSAAEARVVSTPDARVGSEGHDGRPWIRALIIAKIPDRSVVSSEKCE